MSGYLKYPDTITNTPCVRANTPCVRATNTYNFSQSFARVAILILCGHDSHRATQDKNKYAIVSDHTITNDRTITSDRTAFARSHDPNTPSRVHAHRTYHPISFFLKYSKVTRVNPLVNKSPNCSTVSILTSLIFLLTICSRNQIVLIA